MELKWNKPTGKFIASQCGRYMVNKSAGQYMAVRLGTPDRGAWKGSVILGVVDSADGAKELCDDDLLQRD